MSHVSGRDETSEAEAKRQRPRFSLVVPLQDEEDSVVTLLESLGVQTRQPEEVILVDAGSRDRTVERAQSALPSCPVHLVKASRVNPGVARNEGVAQAKEEWIAFTDGGVRLDPRWLEELAEKASGDSDAVFGNYNPVCPSFFTECAAIAYVSRRRPDSTRGESIASCALRRTVFDAVGGFTAFRAAEDLILIEKVLARFRIAYAPSARVEWQIAAGWRRTRVRFAEYSWHNLAAGRWRYWHLGLARSYAALGLALLAGGVCGLGPWVACLVPAFFMARALKSAWLKRNSFEFETMSPLRILGTAAILAVIDSATLLGSVRWLLGRPPSTAEARVGRDRRHRAEQRTPH